MYWFHCTYYVVLFIFIVGSWICVDNPGLMSTTGVMSLGLVTVPGLLQQQQQQQKKNTNDCCVLSSKMALAHYCVLELRLVQVGLILGHLAIGVSAKSFNHAVYKFPWYCSYYAVMSFPSSAPMPITLTNVNNEFAIMKMNLQLSYHIKSSRDLINVAF